MATTSASSARRSAKNKVEPEINFLNITAMMDMMTIILVFLAQEPEHVDGVAAAVRGPAAPEERPDDRARLRARRPGRHRLEVADHRGRDGRLPRPAGRAQYGIEAKYKRGSRNDYFIVPLGSALQSWRDTDKRIRMATGKDPSQSEAILIADSSTPYRLLTEVMYTLGQSEFSKFHMMVLAGLGELEGAGAA
jgi:biopolymer transport protein ExbD